MLRLINRSGVPNCPGALYQTRIKGRNYERLHCNTDRVNAAKSRDEPRYRTSNFEEI